MRTIDRFPSLVLAAVLTGCAPPPEAPDKLEDLCTYVFTHFDDDDPEELQAGLDNLDAWLSKGDNLAQTVEGYQITNLDKEAIQGIDTSTQKVSGLVGAAVANEHEWSLKQMSIATVTADWAEVVPKNYDVYERTFHKDKSCFPSKDCERIAATAYGEAKFAGLIQVVTRNRIQFRWVETEELGWVLLHRSWLTEPAEVSLDSIQVNAQYFLAMTLPDGGGTTRVQATWMDSDYGALPVTEDGAKREIVKSMSNQGEAIDEWLAER
jgi:hypothetical protein